MHWKHLFKKHILERGYDYFLEGEVEGVKRKNDGITATVWGSEEYEVEINFNGDEVEDMYCSCPYAESGEYCKHMAAVLFEWEEKKEEEIIDVVNRTKEEVEHIVGQAKEEIVKGFLVRILQEDERNFLRFKALVNDEISKGDIERYKKQVDSIVDRYLGYDDFISYRQANDFVMEIKDLIDEEVQRMLEQGHYMETFELTNYIFSCMGEVDIDDSDGGIGMILSHCIEIWCKLLENTDACVEEVMFQWFITHFDGTLMDYMEEYIAEILMDYFKEKKYMESKLEFTERKVQEAKRNTDSWSAKYYVGAWAMRHLMVMEEMEKSWEEIEQYCRGNWENDRIREYFISKCIEQKQYNEAIKALEESIQLDTNMPGLVSSFSNQLKEVYKMIGDEIAYKEQLWKLVIEDDAGNIEQYRELKKLYSKQEWIDVREKIFTLLPKNVNREEIYQEEQLYDRLLKCVQTSYGLFILQKYEKILAKEYPKEVLQKYTEELNEMAKYTADRKRYQEWVLILKRMLKIKGGKETVNEIVENWRVLYKNRRAMMEELNRLYEK